MHQITAYVAFGWLAATGLLHFIIDVVSHDLRGHRAPGATGVLYNGLHTSFALGQVTYGLLGLLITWQSAQLLVSRPFAYLSLAAGVGWLLISFLFIEWVPPKFNAGLFVALVILAIVMG